ncbi:hypothetical protein GCM10020001_108320 [Nonomuraea salmonea]
MVLGWVVLTVVAVLTSGPLEDVRVTSGTSLLARGVESARVLDLVAEQSGRSVPTLVIYERTGPLRPADLAAVRHDLRKFARLPDVVGTSSMPLPSADRRALQVTVLLSGRPGVVIAPLVEQVRGIAAAANPPGLVSHVTGAGGVAADYADSFLRVDGTLLALSVTVVLLVLLAVYRSPVLWLIPMLAVAAAYLCSAAAIYALARSGWITLRAATPEVFTVLVFGVATDYALLLVARFRERLRMTPRHRNGPEAGPVERHPHGRRLGPDGGRRRRLPRRRRHQRPPLDRRRSRRRRPHHDGRNGDSPPRPHAPRWPKSLLARHSPPRHPLQPPGPGRADRRVAARSPPGHPRRATGPVLAGSRRRGA